MQTVETHHELHRSRGFTSERAAVDTEGVAVYAARRIAGSDLQAIERYFEMSYPAVSRRVRAVETTLQHDGRLRKWVTGVLGALDGKVKTCPKIQDRIQ